MLSLRQTYELHIVVSLPQSVTFAAFDSFV
jgi:hypothetical protein